MRSDVKFDVLLLDTTNVLGSPSENNQTKTLRSKAAEGTIEKKLKLLYFEILDTILIQYDTRFKN